MQIIHENEYEETMKNIVMPYLLSHRRELYVPGADYPIIFLRKAIMYIFRSIAAMAAAIVLPQTRLWSTSIHGEDISAIF